MYISGLFEKIYLRVSHGLSSVWNKEPLAYSRQSKGEKNESTSGPYDVALSFYSLLSLLYTPYGQLPLLEVQL